MKKRVVLLVDVASTAEARFDEDLREWLNGWRWWMRDWCVLSGDERHEGSSQRG